MQLQLIIKIFGLLLLLYSATLIPPILISWLYQDSALTGFLLALSLTISSGFLLYWLNRKHKKELKIRDGFLVVVLFWTALGLVGALPFYLQTDLQLSLTDTVFESFSGITTTGASILTQLDELAPSLLWYRQQLQWLGGMGIVVLAVAILPMLGIGGMQLYRAEIPGPAKDNKLAPRVSETAKTLWLIYLYLTLACAGAYKLAGMNWFDAITHSFSTVAIGGFSTHDAGIGFFNSATIEAIAMFFMLLAGINFALHFRAFRSFSIKGYFLDPEFKTYFSLMLIGVGVTSAYLYAQNVYPSFIESLRYGAFTSVSLATTTGFTHQDFASWPAFLPIFLLMLSFIGGSAGSTGGGIKVIRFLLLIKQGLREIQQLMHPNALLPVKLNGQPISERVMSAVWGFFVLYIATFAILLLALMLFGLDELSAFSAVAATLNNLGPGVGVVSESFAGLNEPQKWILILSMLLGRLEIFTLLILLTKSFWRT